MLSFLPREIFGIVFSYLDETHWKNPHGNVMSVCKKWKSIYKQYEWNIVLSVCESHLRTSEISEYQSAADDKKPVGSHNQASYSFMHADDVEEIV